MEENPPPASGGCTVFSIYRHRQEITHALRCLSLIPLVPNARFCVRIWLAALDYRLKCRVRVHQSANAFMQRMTICTLLHLYLYIRCYDVHTVLLLFFICIQYVLLCCLCLNHFWGAGRVFLYRVKAIFQNFKPLQYYPLNGRESTLGTGDSKAEHLFYRFS